MVLVTKVEIPEKAWDYFLQSATLPFEVLKEALILVREYTLISVIVILRKHVYLFQEYSVVT